MLQLRFADATEYVADSTLHRPTGVHVWFNRQGGVVARGFRDAGSYWMAWPSLATYQFAAGSSFITAHAVPGAPVDVIWDVYRRSVVPMALQVLGWEALHASSIVTARGVAGFCAPSETGKSTIAFGLRRRGFPQWSDDGLVFRCDGRPVATPLPFEARLRPASLEIFGDTNAWRRGIEGNSPGEQRYTEPMSVGLICLLKRRAGEPDEAPLIRRVEPAVAFPELLIHAHEFDPYDPERRTRMMQTYLDLAAHVPVIEVSFVPNPERLGALLDAIVAGLSLRLPDNDGAAPAHDG